jgi:hypothetical protein
MTQTVFLFSGLTAGFLYYHHIWIETARIPEGGRGPLLSFWFRYGLLALTLALLFRAFPDGRLSIVIGLLSGRPLYLFVNRIRIFGGKDAE